MSTTAEHVSGITVSDVIEPGLVIRGPFGLSLIHI